MPANPYGLLLRRLRGLVAPEQDGDAALLARFVRSRDEGAFTALVRRHGPLVFGLCRRWLGDEQEAEDVFQATFLVLARRAESVRKGQALPSFLYGVALRLARKALSRAARRHQPARGAEPAADPDQLERLCVREMLQGLDEELRRLPERYRVPLVLCHLQGRTQEEAARELAWSKGTLRRRLARGRELLKARLVGRGLSLPALLGAPLLAAGFAAPAPAALLESTTRAALEEGAASRAVAALADAGCRALAPIRLRAALVLLAAASLGVAACLRSFPPVPEPPPPSRVVEAPAGPGEGADPDDPLPEGAVARLGTLRGRAWDSMMGVTFSADGKAVLTCGAGDSVRVWDAETGRPLRRLAAEHVWQMEGPSLSADGKTLAVLATWHRPHTDNTVSVHNAVALWDLPTGKMARTVDVGWATARAALSPDGKTVAYLEFDGNTPGAIHLHDLTGRRPPRSIPTSERDGQAFMKDRFLLFSPGGKYLALGGRLDSYRTFTNGRAFGSLPNAAPPEGFPVHVWDAATGKNVCSLDGPEGRSSCLAFTPDGRSLVTGSYDGAVRVWDLATGKRLRVLPAQGGPVVCLGVTPDGQAVVTGSRGQAPHLTAWDLPAGKELWRRPAEPYQLALSPDGRRVAVVDEDNVLLLHDARTGRPLPGPAGHRGPVTSLAFSPDGKEVASSDGRRVYRWDPATGRLRAEHRVPRGEYRWIAYDRGGVLLTADSGTPLDRLGRPAGSAELGLRVWEPGTGRTRRRLDRADGTVYRLTAGTSAVLSYDAPYLLTPGASAGKRRPSPARVWDLRTGELRCELKGAPPGGWFELSPDGRRAARTEGTLQVWDLTTGEALPHFHHPIDPPAGPTGWPSAYGATVAAAFSPDGKLLATRDSKGPIRVWDLGSGNERRRLNGGWLMAFSPDGRLLATSGGDDRTVTVLDVATGKERRRFAGHEAPVTCLAFSPDGKSLASGSRDTTVLLWDVSGPAPGGKR